MVFIVSVVISFASVVMFAVSVDIFVASVVTFVAAVVLLPLPPFHCCPCYFFFVCFFFRSLLPPFSLPLSFFRCLCRHFIAVSCHLFVVSVVVFAVSESIITASVVVFVFFSSCSLPLSPFLSSLLLSLSISLYTIIVFVFGLCPTCRCEKS